MDNDESTIDPSLHDDNLTATQNGLPPVSSTDDSGPAPVYPVDDNDRIGVSTDKAANPVNMDQGDEEVNRETTGIPD